jgi:hypothetical protein
VLHSGRLRPYLQITAVKKFYSTGPRSPFLVVNLEVALFKRHDNSKKGFHALKDLISMLERWLSILSEPIEALRIRLVKRLSGPNVKKRFCP